MKVGVLGAFSVLFVVALLASCARVQAAVHACSPSVEEGDNTTDLGQIKAFETVIDGDLTNIVWVDDPLLTIPTPHNIKESVFVRTTRGTIYRSSDLGKSWTNVMADLVDSLVPIGGFTGVLRLYNTRREVVFVGYGSNIWSWSSQKGFRKMDNGNLQLQRIRMHPFRDGWILAAAGSDRCYKQQAPGSCFARLYMTKDHGAHWTHVLDYVADFSWGNAKGHLESDDTIYVITWQDKHGEQNFKPYWDMQLRKTGDAFHTQDYLVLDHCVGFIFTDHKTLWAIQPIAPRDMSLRLFTSSDGGRTVQEAQFPVSPDDLTQGRYTILDTREGMSFVNVEHGAFNWGHLYASDATDRQYSVSLEYNKRLPFGAVDFERFDGVDGIYLANYLENQGRGPTKTLLTTDKGGEWFHLEPATPECKATRGCHLNLFGSTSGHPAFYSLESAIGLMIGLGNEGPDLTDAPVNTYVSRDAGLTWSLAREGSHIYEYGDYGGIVVMAKNLEDTNEIIFSWNEGDTWHPCHFTDTPTRIFNIMSGTGPLYGSSQQFVAYGRRGSASVLLYFDFSELHERQCDGAGFPGTPTSDYELWSPGRPTKEGLRCILGRHLGFIRRKPSAQCVNGVNWKRASVKTPCPCTRADYTCDFCYEVPEAQVDKPQDLCTLSEACKKSGYDPAKPPIPCVGNYTITQGYRLVVGDECIHQENDPRMPRVAACPPFPHGDGQNTPLGSGASTVWILGGIIAITAVVLIMAALIFFIVRLVKNRVRFTTVTPSAPNVEDMQSEL